MQRDAGYYECQAHNKHAVDVKVTLLVLPWRTIDKIRIGLIICVKSFGRRGEDSLSITYLFTQVVLRGRRPAETEMCSGWYQASQIAREQSYFICLCSIRYIEGKFRKKLKDFLLSSYLGPPFPSPASRDMDYGNGYGYGLWLTGYLHSLYSVEGVL